MYRVIWVVALLATGEGKRHPHSSPSKQGQSPNAVSNWEIGWVGLHSVIAQRDSYTLFA